MTIEPTLARLQGRELAIADVLRELPAIQAWIEANDVTAESPATLDLYQRVTVTLLYQDLGSRAVTIAERAVEIASLHLDADHEVTLRLKEALGSVYGQAGKAARGIRLFEEVLAARIEKDGPDDPGVWHVRQNLGAAYLEAGRWDQALATVEEIEQYHIRTKGPHDRQTLMARNNRAVITQRAGRIDEAIALWQALVPDFERHLGRDDPDTADVRDALARTNAIARSPGRTNDHEDVDELREFARTQAATRGEYDMRALAARARLATAMRNQGRVEEARTDLDELLADCRDRLGSDHTLTLDVQLRLLSARRLLGQDATLCDDVADLLARSEQTLGRAAFVTVTAATMLASIYEELSRPTDAERVIDDWHSDIIEVLGFDNELTQIVLTQRAQRRYGLERL